MALLEALDDAGIHVDRRAVETGLADARWPGRLDRVALPDGRRALLDAAHNPAGAGRWPPGSRDTPAAPMTLVFAVARDKDVDGMLRALAPAVGDIVVTAVADRTGAGRRRPRGEVRAALAELAPAKGGRVERVHVAATTAAALETAWRLSRDIVVAGSMFLLGAAYPLVGRPDLSNRTGSRPGAEPHAVLSCGVVGSRALVRAARRARLPDRGRAARRRAGAAAGAGGARGDWHPVSAPPPARSGSDGITSATRRSRDRAGGAGDRFSADVVDYYDTEHRLVATGNVVFVTPSSRISAEKVDFNTRTRIGTFYNAIGSASVSDKVDKSFFGTQEPDAFFYGETIEKVGAEPVQDHASGGFTTCVQPTPRWEVSSARRR